MTAYRKCFWPHQWKIFFYIANLILKNARKHEHMSTKVNKAIGSFHKLQKTLPRQSLLITY